MFELSPQIPQTFLIVLLACAAFAAYWRVSRKRDVHPLDFLWLLPAVAALIAAQIWCADGLYESESDPLAVVLLFDRVGAALRRLVTPEEVQA